DRRPGVAGGDVHRRDPDAAVGRDGVEAGRVDARLGVGVLGGGAGGVDGAVVVEVPLEGELLPVGVGRRRRVELDRERHRAVGGRRLDPRDRVELRSEERRVGKEWGPRLALYYKQYKSISIKIIV